MSDNYYQGSGLAFRSKIALVRSGLGLTLPVGPSGPVRVKIFHCPFRSKKKIIKIFYNIYSEKQEKKDFF